jgi:ubiquinone biosynthesis protein
MWLLRPLLTPLASRALRARFSRREVRRLLRDALRDYDHQRSSILREKEAGTRFMVHFAALTLGLYRALLARGVGEVEARRWTCEVPWLAYEKMATVPWVLAASTTRDPLRRFKRATNLLRRFPFRAPTYDIVDVPSEEDVIALDVRRCAVAEYFQARGLASLCVDTWCNLDPPLARKWGARLERTGTLAQGAERCDFRWRVEPRRKRHTLPGDGSPSSCRAGASCQSRLRCRS